MAIDEFEFRRILELFPIVRPRDYYNYIYRRHDEILKKTPSLQGKSKRLLDVESSGQSSSRSTGNKEVTTWQEGDRKHRDTHPIDNRDAFWDKLKSAAEKKVGPAEAEKICKAFQQVYKRLVYEELSLEAAQSFINSFRNPKI